MSEVKKQTTAIDHGKCPVMHGGKTTVGTSTMDWWPKALNTYWGSETEWLASSRYDGEDRDKLETPSPRSRWA